ncbi:MAG: hypothetical protein KA205_04350 [Acidobacteria bacterium]|nr:hypothetical protein [Acidobacteriota bacterium]
MKPLHRAGHVQLPSVDRLSKRERRALLHVFDTLVPTLPIRPLREVTAELKSIRAARRSGGRRSNLDRQALPKTGRD